MSKAAYLRYKKAYSPYTFTGNEICQECHEKKATWRCVFMQGTWHQGNFFVCDEHRDIPSWWEYDTYHRGNQTLKWTRSPFADEENAL
jgi:hypothetical protein